MTKTAKRSPIKECDVRGAFPSEVNEPLFKNLGHNFGQMVADTRFDGLQPMTAVVGGDARPSTSNLKQCIIAGLTANGVNVIHLGGIVPTPVIYWAKEKKQAQAAAIVTASHSPPDWNGLKVMNGNMPPTADDIKQLAGNLEDNSAGPPGAVGFWDDAVESYIKEKTALFAEAGLTGLNIVVDPGNGCQVGVASKILKNLGAQVTTINDRLDGTFSDRHPDCSVAANLSDLSRTVVKEKSDIGIAFDGDGDRLAVVNDTGRVVPPEQVAMILLKGALNPQSGRAVVLDIKSTMHFDRAIEALGGQPVRCRSGHAYMKSKVIETNAILGSEISGHHFLGDLHGLDDPLHVALILLRDLAADGGRLSKHVDALPRQFMTEDLRLSLEDSEIEFFFTTCQTAFNDAQVETIDGIRLLWKDGWFLARKSVTEQGITFRLEGESEKALKAIGARVAGKISSIADQLEDAVTKVTERG